MDSLKKNIAAEIQDSSQENSLAKVSSRKEVVYISIKQESKLTLTQFCRPWILVRIMGKT